MSFHEKSAWACLVGILVVFVPYFVMAFGVPGEASVFASGFLLLRAAFFLTAILVALHIIFALVSPRIRATGDVPAPDELERGIELRSAKRSSWVLASVVMMWCLAAYFVLPASCINELQAVEANPGAIQHLAVPAHQVVFFVNLLFAGFVVANVVYYGSIVFGYRSAS